MLGMLGPTSNSSFQLTIDKFPVHPWDESVFMQTEHFSKINFYYQGKVRVYNLAETALTISGNKIVCSP